MIKIDQDLSILVKIGHDDQDWTNLSRFIKMIKIGHDDQYWSRLVKIGQDDQDWSRYCCPRTAPQQKPRGAEEHKAKLVGLEKQVVVEPTSPPAAQRGGEGARVHLRLVQHVLGQVGLLPGHPGGLPSIETRVKDE